MAGVFSVVGTLQTVSGYVRGILYGGNGKAPKEGRCGTRRCKILFPQRFDRYKAARHIVSYHTSSVRKHCHAVRRLGHAATSAGSFVAVFPEAAAGSAALFRINLSSQACEPRPLERRGSLLHRHGAEPILEGL